jgi:diguanylate cyclase (GGDEF)-like protein
MTITGVVCGSGGMDPPAEREPQDPRTQTGMAASETQNTSSELPYDEQMVSLSAQDLTERLHEEINRAGRHATALACLLVTIGNLEELGREHGAELAERTLDYVTAVLRAQMREFDRIGRPRDGELLLLLPGADGPRGEIVARRVLERLQTIKIEADGKRRPLRISVGLAAWREGVSGDELVSQSRAAAQRASGADPRAGIISTSPPALGRP